MKKLIAGILVAAMLSTVPALSLAEGKKMNSKPEVKDRFQNILVTRAEEMQKMQEKFNDLKAKIEAKRAEMDEKKASFQTKKDEFNAFKDELMGKREAMKVLRRAGDVIREENSKLREDLKNSLTALEESGKVILPGTQTTLDAYIVELKALTAKIKDTKGEIHAILKDNKGFIKDKDYTAMDLAFDEIYAIQTQRNAYLTQINGILKNMVQLLSTVA